MTSERSELLGRAPRGAQTLQDAVNPPEGVDLLILGRSGLARTQERHAPLPPDALAWGWLGAPRWHWLHEWPWGMFTPEEYAALRIPGRGHLAPDWRERFAPGARVPSIAAEVRRRQAYAPG